MKCSPEFIKVYNEAFKTVPDVEKFWKKLSTIICQDLKKLAEEKGIEGCYEYWMETLKAEGANFSIYPKDDKLLIVIYDCPSLKVLDEPYENYCGHCDVLYRNILEPLGFEYKIDYNRKGQCTIDVRDCRSRNKP